MESEWDRIMREVECNLLERKLNYLIFVLVTISNCITSNSGKISYIEIDEKAIRRDGNNPPDKVAVSGRGYYTLSLIRDLSNQDSSIIGYKNFFFTARFFNLGEVDFEAEKVTQLNKSSNSSLQKKK